MPENNKLSGREIEILGLVATGASNKEIAQKLFISINTVKVHLRNIYSKIEVASRTEAAMYAVRQGIVQPGTVPEKGENEAGEARTAGSGLDLLLARVRENRWIGFVALGGLVAIVILAMVLSRELTLPAATNSPPLPTTVPRWQGLAEMPTARYGLAAAVYENQIYAIGGETVQGVTGVVERYDLETNTWEERSPKPHPVADAGAAVIGGRIYVPGGRFPTGGVTNYLEVYDPREDKWEESAPLPKPMSAFALESFEGKLYLFGGWDGQQYLASVYEYDPGQNEWNARAMMPTARGYAGSAVAGGKIYVLGGYDGEKPLVVNEVYLPDRDDGIENPWNEGISLPEGRYGMGVASLADIVYIVGGESDLDSAPDALEYLPQGNEWQPLLSFGSQPVSHLGIVSLETRLYVMGGLINGSQTAQNHTYQAIFTIMIPMVR